MASPGESVVPEAAPLPVPPAPRLVEPEGPVTRQLAREGHLMRNIVRNMVANMEYVLSDLQGIMGDIQSLVVQIDSVTEKIDQQCGTGPGSQRRGTSQNQHVVQKPRCVHGVQSPHGWSTSSPSGVESSNGPAAAALGHGNRRTTALPVESSPKHEAFSPSVIASSAQYCAVDSNSSATPNNESSEKWKRGQRLSYHRPREQRGKKHADSRKSWPNEIRQPVEHWRKGNSTFSTPSGCIAVVYPTVGHSRKVGQPSGEQGPGKVLPSVQHSRPCVDEAKVWAKLNFSASRKSSKQDLGRDSDTRSRTIRSERIYEEISPTKAKPQRRSIVNQFFQPETPTGQRSPVIHPGIVQRAHIVKKPSVEGCGGEANLGHPSPVSKRFSGNFLASSSGSQRVQRSGPDSPISPSRQGTADEAHLYHSLESDLDSEVSDCPDVRSLTPDIDWSYLNLVGDDGYEVAIVPASYRQRGRQFLQQRYPLLQTSPDIVSRLSQVHSSFSRKATMAAPSGLSTPPYPAPPPGGMDKIYYNPVVTHVFCNEVVTSDGYCGCYEAVLDSVLENISGFESSEEAGDEFEEAIHETYVSFDNDFEEDDWDMGLRHEEPEYPEGGNFFADFALDDLYQDLFSNTSSDEDDYSTHETQVLTANFAGYKEKNEAKGYVACCKVEYQQTLIVQEGQTSESDKRSSTPDHSENNSDQSMLRYDELEFPPKSGNSFTDDDCCALKSDSAECQPNFSLWPRPSVGPLPVDSCSMTSVRDKHAQSSTSSEDTSTSRDDAHGSGSSNSNMSFSSPDLVACSPDTDVFATSSDADDLFRSQEEEESPSPFGDDASPRMTAHRQNMMQLRKDFFDSLCTTTTMTTTGATRPTQLVDGHQTPAPVCDNSDRLRGDNLSDTGSYSETTSSSYNRNLNTWTAYAMVHMQADDVSDTASDIINDNGISCSMTSSYLDMSSSYIDADNISITQTGQGFGF
ncbi:uncharacterized protein LOC101845368 [Aplysia californica]|uniref:Uncharacterized protein LOC101845368 n=1 Tax=Aplysia californica TaxID=6500 RepID=A0ABM0JAH6_APLCA|nr:uncharacterized protein LOC101845368 [Aplysia californica]